MSFRHWRRRRGEEEWGRRLGAGFRHNGLNGDRSRSERDGVRLARTEALGDFFHGLRTGGGIEIEALPDDGKPSVGHGGAEGIPPGAQDLQAGGRGLSCSERQAFAWNDAGQEAIKSRPEGIYVMGHDRRCARELLGCGKARRAFSPRVKNAGVTAAANSGDWDARQAEVGEDEMPGFVDEAISRLEILVDESLPVGVGQGGAKLIHPGGERPVIEEAIRLLAAEVIKIAAGHPVHDHRAHAAISDEVKNPDDVGMGQTPDFGRLFLQEDLRAAIEAGSSDKFKGHVLLHLMITRLPDGSHAAFSRAVHQFIAVGKGHPRLRLEHAGAFFGKRPQPLLG